MNIQEIADIIIRKTECDEDRAFLAAASIKMALRQEKYQNSVNPMDEKLRQLLRDIIEQNKSGQ